MIELANYRDLLFIIAVFFVLMAFLILFLKKRSLKSAIDITLPFNIADLYTALGTKNNIVSAKAVQSKVYVVLKDSSIVDVRSVQQLGASGVVMKRDEVIIIFGKISSKIAKAINT